jgi:peptide/nickel transport system substrate-binding protein
MRHTQAGRFLSVTALALLVATLLAACQSSGTGAGSGAGGKPVSGGTLTFATSEAPDCLDPQVSALDVTGLIDRSIFDSLVYMTPDGKFLPWLARRWTISPNGESYTFYLRSGVTFQDGTPLTAEAVKATLDHAVSPQTKSEYAITLLGAYRSSTVINNSTVQMNLSQPDASFLQALSTPYLGISSLKSLQAGQAAECQHPVGSGPFEFVSWTRNTSVVLKRNPAYRWGPPAGTHTSPAYLSKVDILFTPTDSVRYGALTSGQVDVTDGVPAIDVKSLRGLPQFRYIRVDAPGVVYSLVFNTAKGPLADERVRIALQRSVNLNQLVTSLSFGQYQRAWSMLSPSTLDYDPATAGSWPYDPALANKLLNEAGWTGRDAAGYRTKNGKQLTVVWPASAALQQRDERSLLAQGIQAEAKRVGIDVDYISEDNGSFVNSILSGNANIWSSSWERADPDILRLYFAGRGPAQGGDNIFNLSNPQLNEWLDNADSTANAATQRSDYAQAQAYLVQNAYAMPVYVPAKLVGASANVHGLSFDPSSNTLFYGVWLSK